MEGKQCPLTLKRHHRLNLTNVASQNLFAYVIIYVIAVSCTKLSIAFFYKRIFASTLLAWPLVTLVAIYPVRLLCRFCETSL